MFDAAQAAAFCPALASCCWLDVVNELAQASVTCGTATLVCYTDGSYTEGNGAAPLGPVCSSSLALVLFGSYMGPFLHTLLKPVFALLPFRVRSQAFLRRHWSLLLFFLTLLCTFFRTVRLP